MIKITEFTTQELKDLLIGLFTGNLSRSEKEDIEYIEIPPLNNGTKISLKFGICLELLNKREVNPHAVIKEALNKIALDVYTHSEAAANIDLCPENTELPWPWNAIDTTA